MDKLLQDTIFDEDNVKKFAFNEEVSDVFDDMVYRSVPFYQVTQSLIIDYISSFYDNSVKILDLGCSTGEFLKLCSDTFQEENLMGIDSSIDMVDKAKSKNPTLNIINGNVFEKKFYTQDVIVLSLLLQFIRPIKRLELLKKVNAALSKNGLVILFEKIKFSDDLQDSRVIDLYYDFKRINGYSNLAISNKRTALENYLIPYTTTENMDLLKAAGFNHTEVILQYLNFALIIGIK